MQYISKYDFKKKGHAIIRRFLREQWDKDACRYVNLDYTQLKRDQSFKRQLIKEQHGFCCYCMRCLSRKEVALEHVIPQKIKSHDPKEEIKYYAQFGRLKRRLVKYMESIPTDRKLKTPPYPHSIAYENIVHLVPGRYMREVKNILFTSVVTTSERTKKSFRFSLYLK